MQVSLGSNVKLTKAQFNLVTSKRDLKDYVYSIMGMMWSRDILCTHSMTGQSSNAFKDKDAKPRLDQDKVKAICGKLLLLQMFNCQLTRNDLLVIARKDTNITRH